MSASSDVILPPRLRKEARSVEAYGRSVIFPNKTYKNKKMNLVLLVFCLIGFCRSIPNPGGIRVQLPDSPITINMEPQKINVESPVSRIKPPKARFEAPKTGLEPVRARLEPPKARMEPPKARMQPPKARIEPSKARMQPPKARIEPPKARIQPPKSRIEPPKARIESRIESPNSVVPGIDSSRSKLELAKPTFESKQGIFFLILLIKTYLN